MYIRSSFMRNFCMLCLFLPSNLIFLCVQFAPLDCPNAIDSFIGYWKPSLILLLESELWPNLIMSAAAKGVSGFLIILEHEITVHDNAYFLVPSVHPSLQFFILQEQNFYLDYSQFLHHAFMLQVVVTYFYELSTYLQIAVALLNARISLISFNHWLMPLGSPIIALMLSKLSLVVPLVSTHGNADFIFMFIHYCCHHSFLIVAEYYSGCSFSAATYTTRDHTFCWRFKIWYTQVLSSLS